MVNKPLIRDPLVSAPGTGVLSMFGSHRRCDQKTLTIIASDLEDRGQIPRREHSTVEGGGGPFIIHQKKGQVYVKQKNNR